MTTPKDDARQRLLTAAVNLFMSKGYAATSVSMIVQEAGVTKPMLYYYFKNKEGIYLEIMGMAFAEFDVLLEKFSCETAPARETVLNMFEELMEKQMERIEHVRLIYAMIYGPAQGAPQIDFEVFHTKMAQKIGGMIQAGIDRGELGEVDINDFTTLLISVLFFCMDTRVINCSVSMTSDDMRRIINKIFDKILIKVAEV
jgi:AcrR family transcriptional regulator